jgi:hypothetical protein
MHDFPTFNVNIFNNVCRRGRVALEIARRFNFFITLAVEIIPAELYRLNIEHDLESLEEENHFDTLANNANWRDLVVEHMQTLEQQIEHIQQA